MGVPGPRHDGPMGDGDRYAAPPGTLRLAPGETAELTFPGLAPAGYLWSSAVDGAEGVVSLEWERRAPLDPEGVGAGGSESLRVTARSPGRVVLHLAQRRPWERDQPARTAYECAVEVTAPTPPLDG
jgi:predicted secreted protein